MHLRNFLRNAICRSVSSNFNIKNPDGYRKLVMMDMDILMDMKS